jgi:arachidonate 15-lipoxygenase
MVVSGRVVHVPGSWGEAVPCEGAQVEIWDLDGGDANALIFAATCDKQGQFVGGAQPRGPFSLPLVEQPRLEIVVRQGTNAWHALLPPPPSGGLLQLGFPPVVVPWGPEDAPLSPQGVEEDPFDRIRLKAALRDYVWSHSGGLNGLAVCAGLPTVERHNGRYVRERAELFGPQIVNNGLLAAQWWADPFGSLDDYRRMFLAYPTPGTAVRPSAIDDDEEFARQRLQGACPLILSLMEELPEDLPVRDAVLRNLPAPEFSLDQARRERRLFLCDYGDLSPDGVDVTRDQRYMPVPYALFYLADTRSGKRNRLVPLAIRVDRSSQTPVVTPSSPPEVWRNAKLMVQVADAHLHELKYHLWGAHFAFEPWIVATNRNLGDRHALKTLLKRHMVSVIAINEFGRRTLTNPGGFLENLLSPNVQASLDIMSHSARNYRVDEAGFRAQMEKRGVYDSEILPDYPYRDDGQLVWDAINRFVVGYVERYYRDDRAVRVDPQLARFIDDVTSERGGRLAGVTRPDSLEQLSKLVTELIFTSSAYHAALNYAQYEFMAYQPNMPLAAWDKPFQRDGSATDLTRLLPPRESAKDQLDLFWNLTCYQHDKLGAYEWRFMDGEAEKLAEAFRANLRNAGEEIEGRNRQRAVAYPYLHPSRIPNSASV